MPTKKKSKQIKKVLVKKTKKPVKKSAVKKPAPKGKSIKPVKSKSVKKNIAAKKAKVSKPKAKLSLKKIKVEAKKLFKKIVPAKKTAKQVKKIVIQKTKAPVKTSQSKTPTKTVPEKKLSKNVVAINDNVKEIEEKDDLSSEKMPVFALRGSALAQQQFKKTVFEIPSFPQAKIVEDENKNSVAKSKNNKQIASAKSSGKKMNNAATKQVKVNVKYDKSGKVILPEGYKPSDDEKYMNPLQVEYFKRKLANWKKELLNESNETIEHLMEESWNEPDPSDQATIVEQTGLELRTRDRYRKLISKIDAALRRIEEGEYGFCEVTGDPIGLKRLEARPIATMSIAAQEQHELEEKLSLED